MTFRPPNLKSWLFVAFITEAVVFDTWAQQAIIFSKPANDVAEKANAFMPPTSQRPGGAGSYNAPSSIFGKPSAGSYDILPGSPAPVISPETAIRWRKAFDAKKNWTLLTPEEILGVPTPEKLLGLPNPKIDEKLTVEERFMLRQNHEESSNRATNGLPNAALMRNDSPDNPFRRQMENDRPANQTDKSKPGSTEYFNQLLKTTAGSMFGSETKADTAWNNPFTQPAAAPKPDAGQVAAMERFRTLMEPVTLPEKSLTTAYPIPVPVPDPNMQPMPLFNPAGHSFTPLQSGISKPTGINSLPGITSPYSPPKSASPAGLAKLPPWLSDSPQPSGPPSQRSF